MSTDMAEVNNEQGICCPKCGCRHCPKANHEVAKTIAFGDKRSIRRVRRCRHCGWSFNTYERVAGEPDAQGGGE